MIYPSSIPSSLWKKDENVQRFGVAIPFAFSQKHFPKVAWKQHPVLLLCLAHRKKNLLVSAPFGVSCHTESPANKKPCERRHSYDSVQKKSMIHNRVAIHLNINRGCMRSQRYCNTAQTQNSITWWPWLAGSWKAKFIPQNALTSAASRVASQKL